MKQNMVKALQKPGLDSPEKRSSLHHTKSQNDLTLPNFITASSRSFFTKLTLNSSFLDVLNPNEWDHNNDFEKAKEYVQTMNVVNDNAERASLIESYNNQHTKMRINCNISFRLSKCIEPRNIGTQSLGPRNGNNVLTAVADCAIELP